MVFAATCKSSNVCDSLPLLKAVARVLDLIFLGNVVVLFSIEAVWGACEDGPKGQLQNEWQRFSLRAQAGGGGTSSISA